MLPLLVLLLVGCDLRVRSENDALAAIDYWPRQRLLFVAHEGAIDVLSVPEGPEQRGFAMVERLSDPRRSTVVRLSIDRAQARLWAADTSAIYVYEFDPVTRERRIALPIPAEMPITDFVLDREGDALVFVRGGAEIYKIEHATLAVERWLEVVPRGHPAYFGGRVALTQDGRQIVFKSPKDGRMTKLDIASRQLQPIASSSRDDDSADGPLLRMVEGRTVP